MSIYRGAGGAGDAVADSSSEALLIRELAIEVQADADAASDSATAAASSASGAATSATNASNSATAAATSATNASNSASAASTSATNAANSATAAQTAETAAELAETNAETAETNAAASASAASSSASTASTQATNASNSATAAATSATNASNSATAASTSASNASTSATAAAGSASSASTSASNAATSETNAAASASSASTSASTATTQAGIATTQASNASTSATNASNSATSASGSATTATTQATNASNSATAAATSATNASNSASSASTSATNAANSASAAAASAASINLSSIAITGGSINGTTVGATTASTGKFTTLEATGVTTVQAGTVSAPAITTTGDTNTGIYFPAADTIAFTEGGVESMRITAAGDVGIGTNNPSQRLHVQGAVQVNGAATLPSAIGGGLFSYEAPVTRAYVGDGTGYSFRFSRRASSTTTDLMTITDTGDVGIGTAPTQIFDVYKNSVAITKIRGGSATNQGAGYYVWKSDNSGSLCAFGDYANQLGGAVDTLASIYTAGSVPLVFAVSGSERMRITSSGNVLLGQSALPFSNANFADGSIYVNGNAFINNSSGTGQYNVRLDGFSDQLYVVWSNGNTQNNSIYYAYGGTAWVNSSDETLKDIIEPITNAVDKVSQLRSVIGKYKTEEDGTRHPFLIAQDVQKVLPEAVYVNKSRVEGEPDTLGVGYTDVIPLLVSAIQELNAKVTALETQLGTK